jgi:hypothetical protein
MLSPNQVGIASGLFLSDFKSYCIVFLFLDRFCLWMNVFGSWLWFLFAWLIFFAITHDRNVMVSCVGYGTCRF